MDTKLAIIGAGPVGLAAGAHAAERGLDAVILEQGRTVGDNVRRWGHVRLFSVWEHNLDRAAERLLGPAGWKAPDARHLPTGNELYEHYLKPLAHDTPLADAIRLGHRVIAIGRDGLDKARTNGRAQAPFIIDTMTATGPVRIRAAAVIDASGAWHNPNPAGANGLPAMGEKENAAYIRYGTPDVLGRDRTRYAGKRVAVLGSGHSAIGTLIDLVELGRQAPGTRPHWLLRGNDPAKSFGGGDRDGLAARGALGKIFAALLEQGRIDILTGFRVDAVTNGGGDLELHAAGGARALAVDELVVATGVRPDLSFLGELRLGLDPAIDCAPGIAELIDPDVHRCGTVPPHGARELELAEPNFYIAGMKSYGRAPTFLMMTGYEQVRSLVARIAGDDAAAALGELVLPETGVCSAADFYKVACCGPSQQAAPCCGASAFSGEVETLRR
jgi:thioredoxin reductase